MALALGEGGEQNAPLGRAVIGGLVVATIATLFFVPVVFSLLHRRATAPVRHPSESRPEAGGINPPLAGSLSLRSMNLREPESRRWHPTWQVRDCRGVNLGRRRELRREAAPCRHRGGRAHRHRRGGRVGAALATSHGVARRNAANWPSRPSASSRPCRAKPPPA